MDSIARSQKDCDVSASYVMKLELRVNLNLVWVVVVNVGKKSLGVWLLGLRIIYV